MQYPSKHNIWNIELISIVLYILAPSSLELSVINNPPNQNIVNTNTNRLDLSELPIPSVLYYNNITRIRLDIILMDPINPNFLIV